MTEAELDAAARRVDELVQELRAAALPTELIALLLWQRSVMISANCTPDKALKDIEIISRSILKAGRS